MMSRKIACAVLFLSTLNLCAAAYGGNSALGQWSSHVYSVNLPAQKTAPDKLSGFKKMRKDASRVSAAFLKKKIGRNYLSEQIASAFFDGVLNAFVPKKSGDIAMRNPMSIMDRTANKLIVQEKRHLEKWIDKMFTSLPMIGNILTHLVKSQKLYVSNGIPHHEMHSKKPVALHYKLSRHSFSGGTEMQLIGREFHRTPRAVVSYGDEERWRVTVYGKQAQFTLAAKHVNADIEWNLQGMKFKVDLTF